MNYLKIEDELFNNIGYICRLKFNSVVNHTINGKRKGWNTVHNKKIRNLIDRSKKGRCDREGDNPARIIYNYSSYTLSKDEEKALANGLDTHIPGLIDSNRVKAEFEMLYEDILKQAHHLNNEEKDVLKSKVRRICENYANIKVPYKYKECIEKLYKNKGITIMKSDKGRAVVILNKTTYLSKCNSLITTDQFQKLNDDPTKKVEGIVQRTLLKMKEKFTKEEYAKIYPSGSNPGTFYGTAKVHKLQPGDNVDKLIFRPIISNIGTATYKLSKHLAEILSPLGKSKYTINNTADFVSKLKADKAPQEFQMLSLDVESLFTNVPLEETIEIILNRIYRDNLLNTKLTRDEMKKLLLLCTREVHFSFNGELYKQTEGVAMGSPLGPVLANIFMTQLENTMVPKLDKQLYGWKRYVDDVFAYTDPQYITEVITKLNDFHTNINFKYEFEQGKSISFLDVLVMRTDNGHLETTVYRKPTHTNVYIHWNSYAPVSWKYVTAQILVKRAYSLCSNQSLLNGELDIIKEILCKFNNYPVSFVKGIIEREKTHVPQNTSNTNQQQALQLHLPYGGKVGENLVTKLKKVVKRTLPNSSVRTTYKSQRLSSRFQIKDSVKFEHQHNVTYYGKCGKNECQDDYVGHSKRRIVERIIDHNKRDLQSHLLKHAKSTKHKRVWKNDFKILNRNYRTDRHRRISEAFYIKELGPSLNTQDKSYPLKLYN